MTNSPEQSSPPPSPRRRRSLVSRVAIPLGIASVVGVGAGVWFANRFVEQQLAPLVQTNLTQLLDRPVELGKVERYSINSLRFGKSGIPATATDPDRASVEAVEVKFNPIQLLLSRTLKLDVTLIKPTAYIEQDKNGVWVSTAIKDQPDTGFIKTQLDVLRTRDANVELSPAPKRGNKRTLVTLKDVAGEVRPSDQNRRFAYDASGASVNGGNFNLKGETLREEKLQSNLQIQGRDFLVSEIDRLVKLPIDLEKGRVNGNVNVKLRGDDRPLVTGTADFKDVTMKVPQLPQVFTNAAGNLQLDGTQITLEKVTASLGKIPLLANGTVDTEKGFNVAAQVKAVKVEDFLKTFAIQLPFSASGEVRANTKLTGTIDKPILTGTATNTKVAKLDRVNLSKASANFRLDASALKLAITNIQATPTVGGQIVGQGQIDLNEPRSLDLRFRATNVPGDTIARLYNNGTAPPITVGRVNAQARISGTIENVQTVAQFQAPDATYPTIGEVALVGSNGFLRNVVAQVAGGTVIANARSVGDRWQGTVQAVGVQASRFAPQVQGLVSGNFNLSGTTSSFQLADIQASGRAQLTQGNGIVNAQIASNAGLWTAQVQGDGVQLNRFSPDLRGLLSGDIALAGSVNALTPAAIRADGQVRLSEGISLIEQPIVAQIQWDGRKVNVQRATAPGFSANGSILANLDGTPTITALDLNIKTTDYALASLPLPRPPVTDLTGRVDLTGRLTGTPASPSVVGTVAVRGLSLNGITFDPVLNGNLRLAPSQGFSLNVTGQRDRIALALNPNYKPISLNVRRGDATLIGSAQGNIFRLVAKQLPLDGLTIPGVPLARIGTLGGQLSGTLNIDTDRLQVIDGALAVANPRIGAFQGERISTQLVNNGNVIRFAETSLQRGNSRYTLAGNLDLRASPRFEGNVAIVQGKLEDVLQTLQVFRLDDFSRGIEAPTYGKAADVAPIAVGLPQSPLLDQLRRFSEINALLRQVGNQRQNLTIPELADVRGIFSGTISFAASLKTGVSAEFDLQGQNVEWRPYPAFAEVSQNQVIQNPNRVLRAEQVIARGSFADGVVNLLPLRLQSGQSFISFSGNVGGANQSGQLQVANVPIEEINNLYPLPLGVSGKLNATATLSGTRDNPFAIGEITLADGNLNGTPIQSATGSFNYANARLNFGSDITVSGPEPIRIAGDIPLKLPFSSVFPNSNQISLTLDVKNEGLALLNLLTPQVAWQGGTGQVNLQVSGTLLQPNVTGSAVVANAKIAAQALPEPLTGVNGTIRFLRDRINVESLQGQFSKGQVAAQGVLPIFSTLEATDPDFNKPLAVSLNQIALNLKGIYQGGVNGNVAVTGTALSPQIGGEIRLADGQVLLSDETTAASGAAPAPSGGQAGNEPAIEFRNLKLELGDRVRVTRAPIINFLAKGSLNVNGTLNNLEPEGIISLTSGQVNLFTTQFVLARGYRQTARFTPSQGLDPTLNIRLIASVPEVTRNRISTGSESGEVRDDSLLATSLGSLQTVRVQARVAGPASQLFDNLELTSSPSRSQNEIIGLIGGGFVNTLGRGGSTLGIANLAGSALLTNVQGFIGNALGFGEFRLFPSVLNNERRGNSTLGLAAELGVDITPRLSTSILRVLTSEQPTQVSILYRINSQLILRGATDFSGDSRAVFEYEARF